MAKKIVIASDSFKGSASSFEIGTYIAEGIIEVFPEYQTQLFSIADGGEGTVDSILSVCEGEKIKVPVRGPLGDEVIAQYGLIDHGKTAIIEMAEASGITLVPKESQDVMNASTYGTGELIADALQRNVQKLYIGIGGSATNDGGIGMAAALGVRFYDENHQLIAPIAANLNKVALVDVTQIHPQIKDVETIILSDVTNPLCGTNGASAIYGPQKGATPEQVKWLDQALLHYATKVSEVTNTTLQETEGAGAAGGLGFGLMVFLDAHAQRGVDTILELVGIEQAIQTADLVITGEGRLDSQSINGKAPLGIAAIAQKYHVPTVAIVGSASSDLREVYRGGIAGVFDIVNTPMTLEEAIDQTPELVRNTARNVISFFEALQK